MSTPRDAPAPPLRTAIRSRPRAHPPACPRRVCPPPVRADITATATATTAPRARPQPPHSAPRLQPVPVPHGPGAALRPPAGRPRSLWPWQAPLPPPRFLLHDPTSLFKNSAEKEKTIFQSFRAVASRQNL